MDLSTFIKRPILSSVISVLIVLVGVIGLFSLPIERYPSIAPPTVEVSTFFTGASSETILKSVISPLEDQIHGVEKMLYMNSTASNTGEVKISVVFQQGSNPDIDAVNVQNRVQKALAFLPAEVKNYGVTTEKLENSMLRVFSITSPNDRYDYNFLSNYAKITVKPRIMSLSGIGKCDIIGSDYSMRIWLKPQMLSQHKIDPNDIISALASQNIEAATGIIGANSSESYQYTMRYTGRLKTVKEFENIIVRCESDGSILRLSDVARVELGAEFYTQNGETNSHPGVMCILYQSTGSNATDVNNKVTETLADIQRTAPSGLEIVDQMNANDFLYAAIDQVVETLRDAIILVILIVLLFLKDVKSTIIPFISILVSLIGTFAFMMIIGFSINLLTLFALVLVIGTVVDDSIVVVEAVHAKFEEGFESPFEATKEALTGIAKAVLTSSMVFMAVFIPVSFMGGTSGIFYKQFGLTMAVAVGISAVNALTLVPALCALMLKPIKLPAPGEKATFQQRYARWFDGGFEKFSEKYKKTLKVSLKAKPVFWAISLGTLALLIYLMEIMPSGLVPEDDQGIIMVEISTLPGSSLHTTIEVAGNYAKLVKEIDGVKDVTSSAGYGFIAGANVSAGVLVISLDPWEERSGETSFAGICKKLSQLTAQFPQANFTIFSIPMIPGYGNSSNITMYVQDRAGGEIRDLNTVTSNFVAELAKRGVTCFTAFSMGFPQWEVSVDVAKCLRAGLTPQQVLTCMSSYYGGYYASDINLYSKVYKVMVMSEPDNTRDEESLNKSYVRTADGTMAPLSSFVNLKKTLGPDAINTFNKFTAISVSVLPGSSAGATMKTIQQCAEETLPEGYSYEYSGMTREQDSQTSLGLVLILCSFIIYLLLAALYESLVLPLAILFAVPVGLAASYGISYLFGLDNNIYLQTGVIMLIGLLSKTAILITEYAVERHENGMPIDEASIDAAGARIRPIIMTAGAMIIGLIPLVLSVGGVGGQGNFSLGLGTVTGMIVGTIGLLYVTPVFYTTFQRIQDKMKKK